MFFCLGIFGLPPRVLDFWKRKVAKYGTAYLLHAVCLVLVLMNCIFLRYNQLYSFYVIYFAFGLSIWYVVQVVAVASLRVARGLAGGPEIHVKQEHFFKC